MVVVGSSTCCLLETTCYLPTIISSCRKVLNKVIMTWKDFKLKYKVGNIFISEIVQQICFLVELVLFDGLSGRLCLLKLSRSKTMAWDGG